MEPRRGKSAKRGPASLHQESTPASSRGASNQMPGPQVSTTRQAKETLSHGVLAHLHRGFLPSSQGGESKREPFKGLSLDCHSFEGLLEVGWFSKLDILGDYFSGAGFKSYACPMWGSSPLLLGEFLLGETRPGFEFPPAYAAVSARRVGLMVGLCPSLSYLLPQGPSSLLLDVEVAQPVFSLFFRRRLFVCNCGFHVFVGGRAFRILISRHLEPELI